MMARPGDNAREWKRIGTPYEVEQQEDERSWEEFGISLYNRVPTIDGREMKRWGAEFVGTWILVFMHAGLALTVTATRGDKLTFDGAALGSGLVIIAIIMSLGQVSGAHFNPAVSWGFFVKGDFNFIRMLWYWVFQFAAAFVAILMLWALFPSQPADLGANEPVDIRNVRAFFLEWLLTMIFLIIILGTASRGHVLGPNAAIAVGFTLAFLTYFGNSFGGGSMNPARSAAPILINGQRKTIWVYLVGQFAGSTTAALIMRLLEVRPPHMRKEEKELAKGAGQVDLDEAATEEGKKKGSQKREGGNPNAAADRV